METKFKLGDKVRAKNNARYSITTNGWVGEVTFVDGNWIKVFGDGLTGRKEYGKGFLVKAKDFELIKKMDPKKIIITTDNKTTTARMFEGKKIIKSAEAKCSPEDKFDFEIGAKIAFNRLVDGKEEIKPKELLKNGVFGKSKEWGWFVVINDSLVFEKGGMTVIDNYDDGLRISFGYGTLLSEEEIEIIVKAVSFNDAKKERNLIWRRK